MVKYLMIKDYKKIPIKRSGGQPVPLPELCPSPLPPPCPVGLPPDALSPPHTHRSGLADGSIDTVWGPERAPLSRADGKAVALWLLLSPGALPTPPLLQTC